MTTSDVSKPCSMRCTLIRSFLHLAVGAMAAPCFAQGPALQVIPSAIVLDNPEATEQVLVHSIFKNLDLTRRSTYEIVDPSIAAVDATGLVQPKREGQTTLLVQHGVERASIPVQVAGLRSPPAVDFQTQIIPLFSKSGCNAGGCHGKAEGKNGFKLSVFGFDPAADYEAIVKEARGRRVFGESPDKQLCCCSRPPGKSPTAAAGGWTRTACVISVSGAGSLKAPRSQIRRPRSSASKWSRASKS